MALNDRILGKSATFDSIYSLVVKTVENSNANPELKLRILTLLFNYK